MSIHKTDELPVIFTEPLKERITKMKKIIKIYAISIFFFVCFNTFAFAKIQVFIKEVEEPVGRNQSQEKVESFALQKAKRLALEEAGTYMSSLNILHNQKLTSEQMTALAAGVVKTEIVGNPVVKIKNDIVYVKVKTKVSIDTAVLDKQIKGLLNDKKAMGRLEAIQLRVRALENSLEKFQTIGSLTGVLNEQNPARSISQQDNDVLSQVIKVKKTIAKLSEDMDLQFEKDKQKLIKTFSCNKYKKSRPLPKAPVGRKETETVQEYNERMDDYIKKISQINYENEDSIRKISLTKELALANLKANWLLNKTNELEKHIIELQRLQNLQILIPEEKLRVYFKYPQYDKKRIPVRVRYKGSRYEAFWKNLEKVKAKELYDSQNDLIAKGLFQIEEKHGRLITTLTGSIIENTKTKDKVYVQFKSSGIHKLSEITKWLQLKNYDLPHVMQQKELLGAGKK